MEWPFRISKHSLHQHFPAANDMYSLCRSAGALAMQVVDAVSILMRMESRGLLYTIDNIGEERVGIEVWRLIFQHAVAQEEVEALFAIFAVVIGVWIDCNLLFGSYKDTK